MKKIIPWISFKETGNTRHDTSTEANRFKDLGLVQFHQVIDKFYNLKSELTEWYNFIIIGSVNLSSTLSIQITLNLADIGSNALNYSTLFHFFLVTLVQCSIFFLIPLGFLFVIVELNQLCQYTQGSILTITVISIKSVLNEFGDIISSADYSIVFLGFQHFSQYRASIHIIFLACIGWSALFNEFFNDPHLFVLNILRLLMLGILNSEELI